MEVSLGSLKNHLLVSLSWLGGQEQPPTMTPSPLACPSILTSEAFRWPHQLQLRTFQPLQFIQSSRQFPAHSHGAMLLQPSTTGPCLFAHSPWCPACTPHSCSHSRSAHSPCLHAHTCAQHTHPMHPSLHNPTSVPSHRDGCGTLGCALGVVMVVLG